jgi:hypothetical protein
MSETVIIRPRDGQSPGGGDEPRQPLRPARPQYGPGRLLRRVAGVDEAILDWAPEERPRYARLGAIVLNTGLMAALSMSVLLQRVDISVWLVPPVALIWGYLILSFDGWLVASTHGIAGAARFRMFAPRLVISILMGVVIAEPLLLRVFAPAIHTEINTERKAEVDAYESRLRECNPIDVGAVVPATCGKDLLNVADNPQGVRQELALATEERTKLQTLINSINTELTKRENLARDECNGKAGTGFSGVVGEGPNCKRDRAEADRYGTSSGLVAHQSDLIELNRRIDDLTADDGKASTDYTQALNAAITAKVAEKRAAQGDIGILDEDKALGALSAQSGFVLVGSWLLRLLLVAIDCLPVLTKLMSKTTNYDVLVTRQLDSSNRLHDKHLTEQEQHDGSRSDLAIHRNDHFIRTQMASIDEQTREARADHEADLDRQIEELAERLRNNGG